MLRGATALALSSLLDSAGRASAASAATQVKAVIGEGSGGAIGSNFCGFSYEKSLLAVPFFSDRNQRAVGLFKRLGPGNLRIGGNSVDKSQWAANGRGRTAGQIAPSDVDALAAFLNAAGWNALYGVNLATSTPALAAAEVAYVARTLGNNLAGIEIGNEPDGYGGHYFGKEWAPAASTARWQQFADAILAQTPGVTLTGPGIGILNHVNTWTASLAALAPQMKQLRLLTQHYYRADGHSPSSTMNLLLQPDTNLSLALGQLQTLSREYGLPFRFTEANSFYNGGAPGVSNACGSALWALDFLFQLAKGGASGVNFQDGGNFNRGYTPIAHQDAAVYGPQPEYYGLLFFTLAGRGRLRPVSISPEAANATAYAVDSTSGTSNAVIVNKDASQNLAVAIQASRKISKASAIFLTMPSLTSTEGIMIQNATVGKDGSFTPRPAAALPVSNGSVSVSVNAASAALIQMA